MERASNLPRSANRSLPVPDERDKILPAEVLGTRLMAGQLPLEQFVVVRIHCPQLREGPSRFLKSRRAFYVLSALIRLTSQIFFVIFSSSIPHDLKVNILIPKTWPVNDND